MDREYLERHLAAYLDGELSEKDAVEFARALQEHPDLQVRLEGYRKLDRVTRESEIDMPAKGYFDNLAERIDARIAREGVFERSSFVTGLLHPSPRVLAWAGSLAAVLLIAVVGYETYKPAMKSYYKMTAPQSPQPDIQESAATAPRLSVDTLSGESEQQGSAVEPSRERIRTAPVANEVEHKDELTAEGAPPPVKKEQELEAPSEIVAPEKLIKGEEAEAAKGKSAKPTTPPPSASLGEATVSDEVTVKAPAAADSTTIAGFHPEIIIADSNLRVRGGRSNLDVVQAVTAEKSIAMQIESSGEHSTRQEIAYSEAELDSLVALYSGQGTDEADSLAAEYAFRRALAFPKAEYVNEAKERVQAQLDRVGAADTRHYYSLLFERLSRLKVPPRP